MPDSLVSLFGGNQTAFLGGADCQLARGFSEPELPSAGRVRRALLLFHELWVLKACHPIQTRRCPNLYRGKIPFMTKSDDGSQ